ncbi:MAG: peptidoglycan DD-metalloendopeptidase family protein [Oscillospiraceae bacterium]|nr:peptidoglycan DD-metalloendopeptidase family protein [Oscillospiraceae bacterium]
MDKNNNKNDRKMSRRRIAAAIVAGLVALVFLFTCFYPVLLSARAASVDEAKAARDKAKKELDNIKAEKADLVAEYVRFDAQLTEVEDQVIALTAAIENTKEQIAQKELELEEAIENTEAYREAFKKRARIMYENGGTSYLEVLFGSTGFGDFLERLEIVSEIVSYDRGVLNDYVKNQQIIQNSKAEQEALLAQQETDQQSLEYRQEEIELLLEKQQVLIDLITADEATAQKAYAAAEKKYEEEERKAQEEIRRSNISYVGSYKGGKFAWPAPSGTRITSPFGYRTHPISGQTGSLHRGIDISTGYGTNIVAGEAGVVTIAKYNSSYGRYIVINHGNGYTTLYAHNSQLLVSVGQTVSRGQVIAKAGSTGNSTGPHCHFEVSYNGTLQNPLNYLK